LLLVGTVSQAQTIKENYAFAVIGEPKYAINFSHFDLCNPAAPKGGNITLSYIGTFDNFNRFALRGNAAVRTESLYDTPFTTSDDEPGSYYPLIAEGRATPMIFMGRGLDQSARPLPRRLTYSGQRCGIHLP
jgi:microcin C transport system substrate-binding protein